MESSLQNKRKRVDLNEETENFRGMSEKSSSDVRIPWEESGDVKFVGRVNEENGEAHFVTGSKYIGTWDTIGMAGVGRYIMPHGVIFEGEFRDGVFHGQGSLEWPQKQRIDGVWLRGELQEKRYTFSDGLVFQEKDWDYCKFPDRRFFHCVQSGLNPAGKTLKTAKQPTPIIYPSFYDTGDGFFNPDTLTVTSYKSQRVIRIPKKEESDWIIKNCRKGSMNFTGYQSHLNENWSLQPPNLPYNLPFSKESPQSWWKRLTTFERDVEVKTGNEKPVPRGEDISEDSCHCYESESPKGSNFDLGFVISEEDHCTCIEDKKHEIDIEKEEYAAFREIICGEWSKYGNSDLSETICVAPSGRKTAIVNVVAGHESQSSLEGNFQGYSSDEIFDEEMREIERTRVVHDSSRSSLDENKLDVEDDEQLVKEQIKETEEAKKELGEIMMKTKEEEVLKDSGKQEMLQKDKKASNTEDPEDDSLKRIKEEEINEETDEENKQSLEEMPGNEIEIISKKFDFQEIEDPENSLHSGDEDKPKREEDTEDDSLKRIKEDEINEETEEEKKQSSEEIPGTEIEIISKKFDFQEIEDPENSLHSGDEDKPKKEEDTEGIEEDKLKLSSLTKEQKVNDAEVEDEDNEDRDEDKSKSEEAMKEAKLRNLSKQVPKNYIEGINIEVQDPRSVTESKVKFAESGTKENLSSDIDKISDEAKINSTDISNQNYQKTEELGFSKTPIDPKSNLQFVKKSCDPNICLKATSRGCVQYPKKYSAPCKPKNAIELVHLRMKNKKSHL